MAGCLYVPPASAGPYLTWSALQAVASDLGNHDPDLPLDIASGVLKEEIPQ